MINVIYDFETLSQNQLDCPIVSCAFLVFDDDRFLTSPYSFEELVEETKFIKFDIEDQVKNWNRKIDIKTLQWWKEQEPEALKTIKPSKEDVSIENLHSWFVNNVNWDKVKKVYTRNNTFDPIILQYFLKQNNHKMPYPWWLIRDTKSFIDGLTYGHDIKDSFIPPECENKFTKHNPIHDVVLDVMRMQTLIVAKFGE